MLMVLLEIQRINYIENSSALSKLPIQQNLQGLYKRNDKVAIALWDIRIVTAAL